MLSISCEVCGLLPQHIVWMFVSLEMVVTSAPNAVAFIAFSSFGRNGIFWGETLQGDRRCQHLSGYKSLEDQVFLHPSSYMITF